MIFALQKSSSPTLLWLSCSVGVCMIGQGIIWPLVPLFALDLGANGLQIALIIVSFNASRSITNIIVGWLCDNKCHKHFIAIGLLMYSCVSFLFLAANTTELIIFIRLLHGIASAFVVPVAIALTALITPDKQLGKNLGTINFAVMAGLGAGPIIGGILKDAYGTDSVFLTMGIISFLTYIFFLIRVPNTPQSTFQTNNIPRNSLFMLVKHRSLLGLLLLRFLGTVGQGAVYAFLPILGYEMNLISFQIGVILGINIFTIAVFQRVFGNFADKFNLVSAMVLSTGLSGLAVAIMPLYSSFYVILSLNIFMALSNAMALTAGYVIAARVGNKLSMGRIMGFLDTAGSVGFILSPLLSGIIYEYFGLSPVFYGGGTIILIASFVSFRLIRNNADLELVN